MRPLPTTAALLVSLAVMGCAGEGDLAASSPPVNPAVSAAPGEAAASIGAERIYAPGPRTRTYAATDTARAGRPAGHERRDVSGAEADGSWTIALATRADGADAWKPTQTLRVRRVASGAVELVELTDEKEKSVTVFEPPLTLVPASLAAGAVHRAESTLTIRKAADRERVRERGSATQEAAYLGRDEAGRDIVETTMRLEISAARVLRRQAMTLAEDGGVATADEVRSVRVGPITVESSKRRLAQE